MKKLYATLSISILFTANLFSQATQLTVRGFSEGFYRPATGKMTAVLDPVNLPLVCDSGTVEIIDNNNQTLMCFSPLINTDGFAVVSVPQTFNGQSLKVAIKFKNTFHVVSAQPTLMNGQPVMVDLTIPQNVCCHFDSSNGKAKAYSGDINLDGAIDVIDMSQWESDMHNNPTGYNISDINGDRVIDSLDLEIMEYNANLGYTDDRMIYCPMSMTGISVVDNDVLNLYPNPASTKIWLTSSEKTAGDIKVSLLDLTGRNIQNFFWQNDEAEVSFDISNLSPGFYNVFIFMNDGRLITKKFVKE